MHAGLQVRRQLVPTHHARGNSPAVKSANHKTEGVHENAGEDDFVLLLLRRQDIGSKEEARSEGNGHTADLHAGNLKSLSAARSHNEQHGTSGKWNVAKIPGIVGTRMGKQNFHLDDGHDCCLEEDGHGLKLASRRGPTSITRMQ